LENLVNKAGREKREFRVKNSKEEENKGVCFAIQKHFPADLKDTTFKRLVWGKGSASPNEPTRAIEKEKKFFVKKVLF